MIYPRTHVSILVLLAGLFACASAVVAGAPAWSDEFDGTSVNTANWEFMIGNGAEYGNSGWGNNELEYYTSRPENVYVEDGFLHIVAREESYNGFDYTSTRMRTLNKQDFLYGRIESRMKIPSTTGIWPAFWMLPTGSPYGGWASSGEIDIMESVNIATTIYGTIHHGGQWPANVHDGGTLNNGTNFGDDFHVYTVEWEPDVMRWYVDGNLYYSVGSDTWYSTAAPGNPRAPFDNPFHILLNVAVGGNFPGNPNGSSVFPQEMVVDWIRVYAYEVAPQSPYLGDPSPVPGIVEAEDFDNGPEGVAYHDCDGANQGGEYRAAGVDIEDSTEGGYNVGWMCAGEWIEYTVDVDTDGAYLVQTRVASDATGGSFRLLFDDVDATGTVTVPVTGGWQSWTTVTAVAELSAGEQVMRFENLGSSSFEYNLNGFTFVALALQDIDRNGVVDLTDFALMRDCLNGPEVTTPPAGCPQNLFDLSDLDKDGDVDLGDFRDFQHSQFPPN